MKFYEMVRHNPGTNRLDFGGHRVLDPYPRMFKGALPLSIGNVKAPHCGFAG